jgi:RsiW-degrading membrane proteinase PrsW (M82 family)
MTAAPLPASTQAPTVFLACLSGPDQGKRLALSDRASLIGRAADCHVVSSDPEAAPRHVALVLREGTVRFLAIEPAVTAVDGQALNQGALLPSQQLRIGGSLWRVEGQLPAPAPESLLERLGEKISSAAGVERIQGWSAQEMFSEVLRRRTVEESEEHFNAGTRTTTPPLAAISTDWPKPWAFFRALALSLAVYLGFVAAWNEFGNPYLLPGLIMVGSFAVPLSILIFFFEMNVLRNVSLYQLIRLVLVGGVLSIVISLFGFRFSRLDNWLGAMSAGLVEEAGKLVALLVLVNNRRYPWLLNGLLLGAAVGTGFAVFETAGYAFYWGLLQRGSGGMVDILLTRGVLSILGGHALYTGITGAALWRVRGGRPFEWTMVRDPRFLRLFGLAVLLHMFWDSPIELPFLLKYLVVGFAAWVALLGLVQEGLKQVRREQLIAAPTAVG